MGRIFKKILKNSYENDPFKIFSLIREHVKYKHKTNIDICKELMFSRISYNDCFNILHDSVHGILLSRLDPRDRDMIKELSSMLTVSYGNLINGFKDKTTDIRKMIGKSLTQLAQDDKTEGIVYRLTPFAFGTNTRFKHEHFKFILCQILEEDGVIDNLINSKNYTEYCEKSKTILEIMMKVKKIWSKFKASSIRAFDTNTDAQVTELPLIEYMTVNMTTNAFLSVFAFVCGINSTFLTKERPFKKVFTGVTGGDFMLENIKNRLLYMITTGEIDSNDEELMDEIYKFLNDHDKEGILKKIEDKINVKHQWLIGRMVERREGEQIESIADMYEHIKESEWTHFIQ